MKQARLKSRRKRRMKASRPTLATPRPVEPTTTLEPSAAVEPVSPAQSLPKWMKNIPFISMHIAALGVFFISPTPLSLALCVSLYFVRMFGITAGYHRYFSHRAYKTSRAFQFVLAWIGCSSMQKGPLWWAAHHRQHHRHSDGPEDPHSPLERGFWWSHIGWVLDGDHDTPNGPNMSDLTKYAELRWLNTLQWVPGIILAVACWLVDGMSGLFWGFFLSTVVLYHGTFTVNSLCHLWGNRRYKTTDASRNNLWVALITLGEGWHNNHHHYQSSANQGFFWWEIDVSYYIIRAMGIVGLVWDIRKPAPHLLTATAANGAAAEKIELKVSPEANHA
jgi:stearoyl-CoA desaturase (Delta-9 desaturase)